MDTLETLPGGAVAVGHGVGVDVAATLARLARPGRTVAALRERIEELGCEFELRALLHRLLNLISFFILDRSLLEHGHSREPK